MVLRSWLTSVFGRLKFSTTRVRSRKRRTVHSPAPSVVEMLERRQMLTNLIVTSSSGNNTFNIAEEYQVFPYPSNSTPVGSQVATIFVTDPNTATSAPFPQYFVGSTVISSGNTNNAFQMAVVGGRDVIEVWNPYALDAAVNPVFHLTLTSTDNLGNTGTINITINLITHTVQYQNLTQSERLPVVPQYPYGQNQYPDGSGSSFPQFGPVTPYSTASNSITQGGDDNTTSPANYPGGPLAIHHDGVNVLHVAENSPAGTVVGTVNAVSPDSNLFTSRLTYSFVGTVPGFDATHPALSIDPFTGVVRVIDPSFLDFEARANGSGVGNLGIGGLTINTSAPYQDVIFDVQVRATDAVGAFSQTAVPNSLVSTTTGLPIDGAASTAGTTTTDTFLFIRLLDVGESLPSIAKTTTNLTVPENAPITTSVGFFNMVNGTPDYFVPSGGSVRVASAGFNPSEPQQRMSYTIVGGNNPVPGSGNVNGPFAINPDTGEVTINTTNALSYALVNNYNLQIKITTDNPNADALGYTQNVAPLSEIATLHINVTPVALPVTIVKNGPFSINEAAPNGTYVGQVVATDPDTQAPNGLGKLSYSIISGNFISINGTVYNGIFAIDANGNITVKNVTGLTNVAVLSYLQQNSFTITVHVLNTMNGQTTFADTPVVINLISVDSTPPIVQSGSATIPEHLGNGTVVGQVQAQPGQTDFSIANYAIVGGNTNNAFAINPITGQLTVSNSAALMYYFVPNHQFNLTIKVTDNGTPNALFSTGTFTVNLTQVNLPLKMADQPFSINESTPTGTFPGAAPGTINGTLVGTIVITDPDTPSQIPNISSIIITGGNTGGAFGVNLQGQIYVANAAAVVWDVNPVFSLSVTVTEAGVPAYATTATMTITVNQQREAPIVATQVFNVPQHSLAGAVVGTINASDRDNFSVPLSYAITGGNSTGAFAIDPVTGIITVTDPHLVDYTTNPQFNLQITVTDAGNPGYFTTVSDTVYLLQGQAPTLPQNLSITIPEHSANGTPVIPITAANGTGPYSYSIIGGNPGNAFAIDPNTGAITVNNSAALGFLKNPVFGLRVLATDAETPSLGDTATVTIKLSFVDAPPALINLETAHVTYVESTSSFATVPVTSSVIAISPELDNASSATVQITSNYQQGEDQLVYPANIGSISGSWDSVAGTLTLFGNDTFTNYRYALQSIQYQNLSHNPNPSVRTLSFQITDYNNLSGTGNLSSAVVTRQIDVIPVNNPPVLTSVISTTPYTEGQGPVAINPAITINDPDSATLLNATVTITNYVAAEDVLGFTNDGSTMGNIVVVTNSNGTLNLTSPGNTATLAQWQAALEAVTYTNTSGNLNPVNPTITFTVDDGQSINNISNTLTTTVITGAVFPPVLANGNTLAYTEEDPAAAISPLITVASTSTATLASATITLTTYYANQDVLGFVNDGSTMGNIAVQSNAGGVLTLTSAGATATVAQWQSALRAVTYSNSNWTLNTPLTRTVSYQVNDGANVNPTSNVLQSTINITTVNDAPVLSNIELNPVGFVQNTTVRVTSTIRTSDVDSANLTGAIVQITGNYKAGQDLLQFANTPNISGSFNAVTGTLTLSGIDTVANYQAALRSITYTTGNNPGTLARTVTFTVIDDGALSSNSVSRNINVTPVYALPVLSGIESTALQYIQDAAPNYVNATTPISQTVQVSDVDRQALTGATVQITGNYTQYQDFLKFNDTANIKGSFDGSTGTLTLTGLDTLANYTAALQSVAYCNTHDNPVVLPRTVTYTVTNDVSLISNSVSRNINVIHINKPPVLTAVDTTPLNYTENTAPVVIAPNILATDPNSNFITSATVQITGNYNAGQSLDTLAFTNTAKITGSWNAATGTLTLSGKDTVSNYRSALRSVTFANSQDAVIAPQRTVSFTVTDDNPLNSNTVTRNINIATVNQPPVLSGIETFPVIYKTSDPNASNARPITATTVITDYDSPNLRYASIKITGNYVPGEDQLVIDGASAGSLYATWNATTGELALSGLASQSTFLKALDGVTYLNHAQTPTTTPRTVSIQVFDDQLAPSNIVARSVSFSSVNIPPSVSTNSAGPLVYTEQTAASAVAGALTIADPDSPNMVSATVGITAGYIQGQDSLVFANTPHIQGNWNAATGVLTLSGLDSQANYQAALQSVKFYNSSNNPNNSTRTVSFTVNDGLVGSNAANQQINVVGINVPPIIATNSSGPVAYSQAGGPALLAPAFTALDPESNNLTRATIAITPGTYQRGNDVLTFVNTLSIKGNFDAQTGILTLTGTDSVSNYRAAIRTITYQYANGTPLSSTKAITFQVLDGINVSNIVTQNISVAP